MGVTFKIFLTPENDYPNSKNATFVKREGEEEEEREKRASFPHPGEFDIYCTILIQTTFIFLADKLHEVFMK